MSTPPYPPPSYSTVPPPAPNSGYYNPYPPYQGYPPAAPQPFDSYPPPIYEQNQPHPHPYHNQGQTPSAPRTMYPRPKYSQPAKISNAIYVRNLPYNLSVDEFMSIFSKFGEIATTFTNKISSRGFAFVTYYDIRSAISAIEQMKDQKVHNRQPATTFSFNPPEYSKLNAHETSSMVLVKPLENNTNNTPATENQATTETTVQPSDQQQSSTFNSFFGLSQANTLDIESVKEALSHFGEIYKATELDSNQFVVQYFDFRNARNVIASADKIIINGQKVALESYVEPDEGVSYENPSAAPGYPSPSQAHPAGVPGYPQPYQTNNSPHHHGNNGGGNRNNRNNRNNNHGNRHGNRPPQPPKHQQPFQPQQPLPPPFIPQNQPLPPQIQSQQPPVMPPSIPPQYPMPPQTQFQGAPPQMQYMMYPQSAQPPPNPPQQQPQQQPMPPIQQ